MNAESPRNLLKTFKLLIGGLIYFFGLTLECCAMLSLFSHINFLQSVPKELMILHTTAVLIMAASLHSILPKKYQTNIFGTIACFFLLGFFIPILGNVGLFMVYVFGILSQKERDGYDKFLQTTLSPGMPNRAPDLPSKSKFGSHGMPSRLSKTTDIGTQLGIVLSTRSMRDENAVPLLNTALKSPSDDVRLLAFSLLEKKNSEYNARIEHLHKYLDKSDKNTKTHLLIAQNYINLVTLGLVQKEMKPQTLKKASTHLREALNETPTDGTSRFLLGQVLLEEGRIDQAEAAFLKALEYGCSPIEVYPFLSQAAYMNRQFWKIPQYIEKIPFEERKYLTQNATINRMQPKAS